MKTKLIVSIVLLFAWAHSAHATAVMMKLAPRESVNRNPKIFGYDIRTAFIVLDLDHVSYFMSEGVIGNCQWFLLRGPEKHPDAPPGLVKFMKSSRFDLKKRQILLWVRDPVEFLSLFIAYRDAAMKRTPLALPKLLNAGSGGGGWQPPHYDGPPKQWPEPTVSECECAAEFCLSSDGTTSFSVSCGDYSITFASDGEISIGAESERGNIELPIAK